MSTFVIKCRIFKTSFVRIRKVKCFSSMREITCVFVCAWKVIYRKQIRDKCLIGSLHLHHLLSTAMTILVLNMWQFYRIEFRRDAFLKLSNDKIKVIRQIVTFFKKPKMGRNQVYKNKTRLKNVMHSINREKTRQHQSKNLNHRVQKSHIKAKSSLTLIHLMGLSI